MNEYGSKRNPFVFFVDFNFRFPLVYRLDELIHNDIWISFPGYTNEKSIQGTLPFTFDKKPIDYALYQKAFNQVKNSIKRGDTFLLNLTFPTTVRTDLSLEEMYHYSEAKYKLKFKDRFVVFSPETFVSIKHNVIACHPMKGTMDTNIREAENRLMNDVKEVSEHNTIVDLIRNDLSIVAKNVKVEKFRYIDKIRTHEKQLLQTSSKISGDLPKDWNENLGDLIAKILPAGSITGAPKKKTIEIINQTEGYERGYFTGVCGYFDGKEFDSAVLIRYIEKNDDAYIFKSGGGITSFSDCETEYSELIDKVYVPIVRNDKD